MNKPTKFYHFLTDVNNYRASVLSNVETKVLETVLLQKVANAVFLRQILSI